jgi:hypothetical protein
VWQWLQPHGEETAYDFIFASVVALDSEAGRRCLDNDHWLELTRFILHVHGHRLYLRKLMPTLLDTNGAQTNISRVAALLTDNVEVTPRDAQVAVCAWRQLKTKH